MITLAVPRVVSDQAGNPGIHSVFLFFWFCAFSFVRWFRDPLPPGHHNLRFSYKCSFLCTKTLATTLGAMIACEYGTSSSEL